jgi:hypothetical protein
MRVFTSGPLYPSIQSGNMPPVKIVLKSAAQEKPGCQKVPAKSRLTLAHPGGAARAPNRLALAWRLCQRSRSPVPPGPTRAACRRSYRSGSRRHDAFVWPGGTGGERASWVDHGVVHWASNARTLSINHRFFCRHGFLNLASSRGTGCARSIGPGYRDMFDRALSGGGKTYGAVSSFQCRFITAAGRPMPRTKCWVRKRIMPSAMAGVAMQMSSRELAASFLKVGPAWTTATSPSSLVK